MVTRTRKTIRPMIIFREMVLPQVGPTSCSSIWSTPIPAVRASAARSWSPFRVGNTIGGAGVVAVADGLTAGEVEEDGEAPGDAEAEGLGVGVDVALGLAVGDPVGLTEGDGLVVGVL